MQPVDAAARCPRLLAVSVQAMNGDDTAIGLAVNAPLSNEKHTRRSGWCLQLPLAGHVQLQQLPLLTLRMRRILQEPAVIAVDESRDRNLAMFCSGGIRFRHTCRKGLRQHLAGSVHVVVVLVRGIERGANESSHR